MAGRKPSVGAGTVVYAVGDIHGRADLLDRLLARVREDAAARSERRKVLVFLGDYIDRGPESRRVIDLLAAEDPDGPERVFLKGNHEDAMLGFLASPEIGFQWLGFGGAATLRSYGVDPHAAHVDGGFELLRRELARALPLSHRRFLDRLALCHEEGDYLFVHAGVRPGIPLDRQDPDDLIWIRGAFLESREDFGKTVVHGHSIAPLPELRANRIGIDTGAFATGVLTCLVLRGARRAFIQTPRPPRGGREERWSG